MHCEYFPFMFTSRQKFSEAAGILKQAAKEFH